MNTELVSIFSDDNVEFTSLQAGGIDFTDSALTPAQVMTLGSSTNQFYITQPTSSHGYFEIQFNLAQGTTSGSGFWGCNFNFGSSACGVLIRQALAHLVDKNQYNIQDAGCKGTCIPIDNSVPPSDGLATPNSCVYDTRAFSATGPYAGQNHNTGNNAPGALGCDVGPPSAPKGGVSYNIAPSTGTCNGVTCNFAWQRDLGTRDFCAAADDLVAAFATLGETVTENPLTCVLNFIPPSVTGSPINIYAQLDTARHDLGTGFIQQICALFGKGYITGCNTSGSSPRIVSSPNGFVTGDIATIVYGPINTFPGFATCNAAGGAPCAPNNDWHIYTAAFLGVFPYDTSIYGRYDSLFVSAPSVANPCLAKTSTRSADNYVYACLPSYDTWAHATEFSGCLTAAGDPIPPDASNTIAGTCSGATGTCPATPIACSAQSAGFEAELIAEQNAITIPVFSQRVQQAYLPANGIGTGAPTQWSRPVNNVGVGLANYYLWLNAWAASPAGGAGVIRQGFSQQARSLSPYIATTPWDSYMVNNVYDTLYRQNPLNNGQILDWMTSSHMFFNCGGLCTSSQIGHSPPPGTTAIINNTLRPRLGGAPTPFWHDGQQVTAWDVAFSYLSLVQNGAFQAAGLSGIISGITVLGNNKFELDLYGDGPFTELTIGDISITPGHIWYTPSSGCPSSWGAVTSLPLPAVFPDVASTCLNTSGTLSGLHYDPLASGTLIGSGPWTCQNTIPPLGTTSPIVGGGCSSDGTGTPPPGGTFTLTRFGCAITNPSGIVQTKCVSFYDGASSQFYLRSSSWLAFVVWTGFSGILSSDVLNAAHIAGNCSFTSLTPGCRQWEQGIGNPNGDGVTCCPFSFLTAVALASSYLFPEFQLAGVDKAPPVLYETGATVPILNPSILASKTCSTAGNTFLNGAGYDC